jgi:hypothetical protein
LMGDERTVKHAQTGSKDPIAYFRFPQLIKNSSK